ncbi:hypothetical protein H8356DRAFT_1294341 [Neocallimastix lanati (nom. inval.)]|nr:hypothetical protein H8356DRAFT_1294341 [Neocallimastix sp. JGI-2020a]
MFVKKFLSIFTLLFLGRHLTTVSAACEPTYGTGYECGSCTDEGDIGGLHYVNSKVIEVYESGKCREVTTPGYYKIESNYYSVGQDGNHSEAPLNIGSNCASAGDLYTGGYLCLKDNDTTNVINISGNDGNLYVVPNVGTLLHNSATNVLVKSRENALVLVTTTASTNYLAKDTGGILSSAGNFIAVNSDIELDDSITGKEYCVDDESKIITERPKNYCDTVSDPAINCDKYYTCTDGVCIDTTTTLSGTDGGYYIVYNNELLPDVATNSGSGTLYHCSGTPVSCSIDNTTIGYLKNADTEHNTDDGIPYIECKATTTTVTVNSVTVAQNSCKAIVKPSDEACSNSLVGSLIYNSEYKLCIDASTSVQVGAANYLVDANKVSTFEATGVQSGYFVVVEVDTDGNFIRRAQTGKKYIYALKTGKRVYNKGETGYDAAMCSGNTLNTSAADEYILNKSNGDLVDYYKINA